MERKLKRAEDSRLSDRMLFRLFDYQRFENDPQLQTLIDGVESAYGAELSDGDLARVSAAGEPYCRKKRTDGRGGGGI